MPATLTATPFTFRQPHLHLRVFSEPPAKFTVQSRSREPRFPGQNVQQGSAAASDRSVEPGAFTEAVLPLNG